VTTQRETARLRGNGAGGGYSKLFWNSHYAPPSASQQVPRSETERLLEAGIAEIVAARAAAKCAVTDEARARYKRAAEDMANWLADDLLKMRKRVVPEPPGRRVPPPLGALRRELDLQRKLTAARAEVCQCEIALRATRASEDLEIWGQWESRMWALGCAEQTVRELERELRPWL
jgi:hypothetical protein